MRPVGYLVIAYPGVSHTFVMREVQALRRAGTAIRTYSVHRSGPSDILSVDDAHEASTTTALLPVPPLQMIAITGLAVLRHPVAVTSALAASLRRGAGWRGRLWQFFYFVEALLLWHYCRRDGVRHLHAHFANNAADIARTTTDLGQRVDGPRTWSWSFTMHGPTEFAAPERFGLAGKVRDASFVACISDYCRARLADVADLPDSERLLLVRCGLELSRFPVVDREHGDGPLRVLCVGRLVEEKGQRLLVQAVAQLAHGGLEVELVLVGAGPQQAAIEAEIRRLDVEPLVTLTGAVGQDEIGAWYAWADVFALLSFAEGLPVVLMEAMATGLPVVTTEIAGIPELVEDGVSGFVVPAGDVPRATAALRALAADRELAARLGASARRSVEKQHDVDQCVVPLAAVFSRWAAG
jgi:glycosyltransferase involved in cell wall biosynthesis